MTRSAFVSSLLRLQVFLPPLLERGPAKPAVALHEVLRLARIQLAVSRPRCRRITLRRVQQRELGEKVRCQDLFEPTFGSSASGMMCL